MEVPRASRAVGPVVAARRRMYSAYEYPSVSMTRPATTRGASGRPEEPTRTPPRGAEPPPPLVLAPPLPCTGLVMAAGGSTSSKTRQGANASGRNHKGRGFGGSDDGRDADALAAAAAAPCAARAARAAFSAALSAAASSVAARGFAVGSKRPTGSEVDREDRREASFRSCRRLASSSAAFVARTKLAVTHIDLHGMRLCGGPVPPACASH
jgi:hypothetical protein